MGFVVVVVGHCWPVLRQGLHLPARLNGSAVVVIRNYVVDLQRMVWVMSSISHGSHGKGGAMAFIPRVWAVSHSQAS